MLRDTVYASGFVSIKRQELLDAPRVQRMINADGITASLGVLLECGYDKAILSSPLEPFLEREFEETVEFFCSYCTDRALEAACLIPFDYHNAKAAAKLRQGKVENQAFYSVGSKEKDFVKNAVLARDYDQLPQLMTNALELLDEGSSTPSGRDIDTTLDRAMYQDIAQTAQKIQSPTIRRYFAAKADICNIITAARLRSLGLKEYQNQFVEGGSIPLDSFWAILSGNAKQINDEFFDSDYADIVDELAAALEKNRDIHDIVCRLEEVLFCLSQGQLYDIRSDEPLFAYYVQKLEEIKTIKLIIAYQRKHISLDRLKTKLRSVYA